MFIDETKKFIITFVWSKAVTPFDNLMLNSDNNILVVNDKAYTLSTCNYSLTEIMTIINNIVQADMSSFYITFS